MSVPKRVVERLQSNLKPLLPVLQAQKARDVSEADTVTLVKDLLSSVFGFDKYAELTSEHSIRGTFCDLAIKLDGKLQLLIEVKAIGIDLKDNHVKQAVDYAVNQGVEWVILTNAIHWQLYHVIFKKPVDKQEVCSVCLSDLNTRNSDDLEKLYLFTREGVTKNALSEYRDRKDATSRFMLAAILLNSESVLSAIRRDVRRVSDIAIDQDVIEKMLKEQVIKREAVEGDKFDAAVKRFNRANNEKPSRKEGSGPENIVIEATAADTQASAKN